MLHIITKLAATEQSTRRMGIQTSMAISSKYTSSEMAHETTTHCRVRSVRNILSHYKLRRQHTDAGGGAILSLQQELLAFIDKSTHINYLPSVQCG